MVMNMALCFNPAPRHAYVRKEFHHG